VTLPSKPLFEVRPHLGHHGPDRLPPRVTAAFIISMTTASNSSALAPSSVAMRFDEASVRLGDQFAVLGLRSSNAPQRQAVLDSVAPFVNRNLSSFLTLNVK
jgi:hypothetical protein